MTHRTSTTKLSLPSLWDR